MRAATRANGSPMMSMNHGVTTVSNAPSANGGCNASAATSSRPGRAGAGRREPAQHGVILDASRRDRKFVQLDRAPGKQLARREQQQRIEIRRHRQRGIGRCVQIVGQPPGAGALHQRAAQAGKLPPSSARSSFIAAWFSSSPHDQSRCRFT